VSRRLLGGRSFLGSGSHCWYLDECRVRGQGTESIEAKSGFGRNHKEGEGINKRISGKEVSINKEETRSAFRSLQYHKSRWRCCIGEGGAGE
jgi:hypothetical protein